MQLAGIMATPRPLSRFWGWGKNIVCVGRNYGDHTREIESMLFLKLSTAYTPEGSPILMPAYSCNLHHELELGMVMGKHGLAAMDYVSSYALCLDITARDVQDECKKKGLPWTLAKSFMASCPVSVFVPKEKIPDPPNLRLWLKEGETSFMTFSIPYIINYVSKIMTLEEGDIILTRTTKGVEPVKENDEIQAGIHGVVSMRLKVERPEY
uniref:Oxaloacetate tautomerase FAHD1, mitochondrial n=1 Tax=Gorilla gorilla gorilla TaxID=9595 RepID=A0A2I2Z9U3_GORGO